jgi:hypothetical protein
MRVLRKPGTYVRNQAWKNLALATLSLLILGIAFLPAIPNLLFLRIGLLEEAQLAISLAALVAFFIFLRRYRGYRSGAEGEQHVAHLLASALDDDYYLLNDVYFRDVGGDIDHIVLGPNGIFVIETKNWSGRITCDGDEWRRENRGNFGSPSKQVKKNASRIKKAIGDTTGLTTWVEGIVVFSNRHAELHLKHPTVPVLRPHELVNFIATYKSGGNYALERLEKIGKEILKQAN